MLGGVKQITSQELAAMLIDKDRRWQEKGGSDNALTFRKHQCTSNPPSQLKTKKGLAITAGRPSTSKRKARVRVEARKGKTLERRPKATELKGTELNRQSVHSTTTLTLPKNPPSSLVPN